MTDKPLPEGIKVTDNHDVMLYVGDWLTTLYGNINRADVEEIVHRVAAAVAEQCAASLEAACAYEDWNEQGRTAAEAIRALFPES